jgi:hypothetical protein
MQRNDEAVCCMKEIPRLVGRQGEKKKQKETEDLINMYELLDREKCSLPIFVAADLNKLPTVRATDADVCSLVVQMDKLKSSIDDMRIQLNQVINVKTVSENKKKEAPRTEEPSKIKKSEENYVNNKKIIAEVVKEWNDSEPGWSVVNKEKRKPTFGTKENNSGKVLKAAKSKRTWHLYVGNLERGMSALDVRDYLIECGAEVFDCIAINEWAEDNRPASFHVEVDYDSKEKVMNEQFWNRGVKVRNWFFPRKKDKSGQ